MIVTRFAPSPTGYLHIGHAYSALFAAREAERAGGRFVLRVEDIDRGRCRPEFEAAIYEDLAWLGLTWEFPVRRQSEHFADYAAALDALAARGLLYPCFCTRAEIAAEIAQSAGAPHGTGAVYPGTCKKLPPEERRARIAKGAAYALRLDSAGGAAQAGALTFEESGDAEGVARGTVRVRPELLGDVVLARKDTPASYHLCAVYDDALQGVTLVTRGADLSAATHTQRLLQALLGLPAPRYKHHKLLTDGEGKRFAKRNRTHTLREIRDSGTSAEALKRQLGF